jgi:hypothetical protein
MRIFYYTLMRNTKDNEEVQKRGVVGCVYCVGAPLNMDLQDVRKTGKLRNALPVRIDSTHVCYNDPLMLPCLSLGLVIMLAHNRMRFRAHYGSDEECRHQLSSFGIPIAAFPVSPRGEFNLENHRTFMTMQRAIEAAKSKGKEHLYVAQKAKEKPKEKARSRQSMIKEDVFVAAPHLILNEPTGYGGLMGVLPQLTFTNQWWSLVGAPNLPSEVPLQRQLPVVPQLRIIGPTGASRPPLKFWESPAKPCVIASRPPVETWESRPKPYVIYDPLQNDILFGRGKQIQERIGNVRFREMLDKHIGQCDSDEKGASAKVAACIAHLVKEEGGRFLKELKDGGWFEVDEATARAKISHAFRTRRKAFQAVLKKDKSAA